MIEKAIQHMNERFTNFAKMLGERRVGFKIEEVMTGWHEFEQGIEPGEHKKGKHPMGFRLTWGAPKLSDWLIPGEEEFMLLPFEGTVSMDEYCYDKPCQGKLHLNYLTDQSARYFFDFQAFGRLHHFMAEKVDVKPWNLHVSYTTCYGKLYDTLTGTLISRSETRFNFLG